MTQKRVRITSENNPLAGSAGVIRAIEDSSGDTPEDWEAIVEQLQKACLEQTELVREAQDALADAQRTLVIQRQTIASQQAELEELRRNLARSAGLIASLEERLENMQETIAHLETRRAEHEHNQARVQQLEALLLETERKTENHLLSIQTAERQLTEARERIVTLERQVLQLKAILDSQKLSRTQPATREAPVPAPSAPTAQPVRKIDLPPFLAH